MLALLETLPLPQRMAIAYAPKRLRDETLGVLALDAHLAGLLRRTREPLLGQARIAWWRERLEEPPEQRPAGDPLLDRLAAWRGHEPALVALVDGWEGLLAERLDGDGIAAFAEGRAAAFVGLAALAGEAADGDAVARAATRWALVDLAANVSRPDEAAAALAAARALGRAGLPAALRPLTVLDGLARRALARGGGPLAEDPLAGLAALRLGILGR